MGLKHLRTTEEMDTKNEYIITSIHDSLIYYNIVDVKNTAYFCTCATLNSLTISS